MYDYIKSLHIIFVITWFAGLFYIVRLFVYQIEAAAMPSPEKEILQKQYKIMTYRLWYIITWPSSILASFFAYCLLFFTDIGKAWLQMPWMHVKLVAVVTILIYHFYCSRVLKQFQRLENLKSHVWFRWFNEFPVLMMLLVIIMVVVKPF